jgi:hypothetical protein
MNTNSIAGRIIEFNRKGEEGAQRKMKPWGFLPISLAFRSGIRKFAAKTKQDDSGCVKRRFLRLPFARLLRLCGEIFFRLPFLAALCFTACPVEPENEGGALIEVSLPIDGSGTRHCYDLSTGKEASPAGGNWDLALEAHGGAFFVLTNSGVTAAETEPASSGLGGVWFTDSTDFNAVTSPDQKVVPAADSEYAPYTADVYRHTMVMAADPVKQRLNVITYAGYPSGDGLAADTPFLYNQPGDMAVYSPYNFNKKQAYTMQGMPPNYTPTKQVYIVRHGDGERHSKVQLSEVYLERGSDPSQFVMRVRHELLE